MTEQDINKVRLIIKKNPHLLWYIKDYDSISIESMVEAILNYGDWNDFKELKSAIGITNVSDVFQEIINKKRVNLRSQTVGYFQKYFNKYAH